MKILGVAGYSGSGKTTLIEQLIPRLTVRGLRVSLIKHAHHGFDVDQPGKDSYRHREAGAQEVLIASGRRWALMHELRNEPEPALDELLAHLSPCDLVLVEGYKQSPIPKLEVHRLASKQARLPQDLWIIAVATDAQLIDQEHGRAVLPLNDHEAIAHWVLGFIDQTEVPERVSTY